MNIKRILPGNIALNVLDGIDTQQVIERPLEHVLWALKGLLALSCYQVNNHLVIMTRSAKGREYAESYSW